MQPTHEDVSADHPVVSREAWLAARRELLVKEKAFMKQIDAFRHEQRMLPWTKVDEPYTFDAPDGKKSLSDLFRGKSQLFVKHFMLAPGQKGQCVGCSLVVDDVSGLLPHIENHDISYVAISRAPIDEIEVVRKRMDWQFHWVSSFNNDFNYDYHASFRPEDVAAGKAMWNFKVGHKNTGEQSGISVFFKNDHGEIFHTYSTFGRGDEQFMSIFSIFDIVPRGRQENGPLYSIPDWARLHNQYGRGGKVNSDGSWQADEHTCCQGE